MNTSLLNTRFADPLLTPTGSLQCNVFGTDVARPVPNATIRITQVSTGKVQEELITDTSGQTAILNLEAPPLEYSLEPEQTTMPYSVYNLEIMAEGYENLLIEDVQIFATTTALQEIRLVPQVNLTRQERVIIISPHTLWGEYAPKIPEDDVKPLPDPSGYVVLDKPVIPEFIVVHDGLPNNAATNYYIPFKNYIKNVASSEIYSTWPASTIRANILAILSFTLNRVFTEWYRNKGKNFTITSSTAYDHAFFYGRNIYKEISVIVDEIFTNYITKPGIRQPLFTQYCDGVKVSCPNWMTQWGSKYLGDQGLSGLDILRRYYGQSIYLTQAEKVNGVPSSYPGAPLRRGSSGKDVRTIQTQLNAISNNFPAIPKIKVDGAFGPGTENSVKKFQEIFGMPVTGIVDSATWYRISDIYVATQKLSELV